jgi:maltose O-acetyltransferase
LFEEIIAFIRRNGPREMGAHLLEIYVGALLRWLPGPEGIILRGLFYRTLLKGDVRNLILYPKVYMVFTRHITMGRRVAINVGTYIDGRGGITFGDNVLVGPNVFIGSHDHDIWSRDGRPYAQRSNIPKPVTIGANVWIGANVVICPGITLGDGCVVAGGAVVTKSFPAGMLIGGNPARVIRPVMPPETA